MNVEDVRIGEEYYVNSATAKGTWRAHEIYKDKNENPIVVVKRVTTRPARGSDRRTVSPDQLVPKKQTKQKEYQMKVVEVLNTVGKLSNGSEIQSVVVTHTIKTRGPKSKGV